MTYEEQTPLVVNMARLNLRISCKSFVIKKENIVATSEIPRETKTISRVTLSLNSTNLLTLFCDVIADLTGVFLLC